MRDLGRAVMVLLNSREWMVLGCKGPGSMYLQAVTRNMEASGMGCSLVCWAGWGPCQKGKPRGALKTAPSIAEKKKSTRRSDKIGDLRVWDGRPMKSGDFIPGLFHLVLAFQGTRDDRGTRIKIVGRSESRTWEHRQPGLQAWMF